MHHEKITMTWMEDKQKWLMKGENGKFLQDFFDCNTIEHWFEGLDKTKDNKFLISVAKV